MTDVDNIQHFIAAEKKRIEREKQDLILSNTPRNNVQTSNGQNRSVTQNESTSMTKPEQPKAVLIDTSPRGIPFGTYGDVQEKLKQQRAEEYKKFLAEKKYRSGGVQSVQKTTKEDKPSMQSILSKPPKPVETSEGDLPTSDTHHAASVNYDTELRDRRERPRDKSYDELYMAYQQLLAKKREEERQYRAPLEDPYYNPRRVHFDDDDSRLARLYSDTWLDGGHRLTDRNERRRRDDMGPPLDVDGVRGGGRRQERDDTETQLSTKSALVKREVPERVSRSAPGQAVPILGELDMSPEVKQQRQTRYREELEAQIKEREMQKKRNRRQTSPSSTENNVRNSNQSTIQPIGGTVNQQAPLSRHENIVPPLQLGANPPYFNAYQQNQLYNYPASLSALQPSTMNTSPLMAAANPFSMRDTYAGYQPSWATGPQQPQRGVTTNTIVPSSDQSAGHHSQYGDFGEHIGVLPMHDENTNQNRNRQQSYRDELSRQMVEKEMKKKKAKEDEERYQMKLEREIAEYDPWGKAGGGAPLKDATGHLVSDLRQMHQYNKEGTIISPRDRGHKTELSPRNDMYTSKEQTTSSLASNTQDTSQPTPFVSQIHTNNTQANPKMEYQDYLKQQIEEKKRKKKLEDDRLSEIAAREDEIIKQQQLKLQREYEAELEGAKKKEEAARIKNEEIREAAERKKKELEKERIEKDRLEDEKLRKELDERLKKAKEKQVTSGGASNIQNGTRPSSPPIPTLQKKQPPSSPPVPSLQNQRSNSPPIPTIQNKTRTNTPVNHEKKNDQRNVESRGSVKRQSSHDQIRSRPSSNHGSDGDSGGGLPYKQEEASYHYHHRSSSAAADHDVLSQLTSLRRQLKSEEVKVQQQLSENKEKYFQLRENSGNRRGNRKPTSNVFDNVLKRNPGVVQRDQETKSFKTMSDFNKLKYEDTSSLHGDFLSQYPDPALTGSTLELQQQALIKEQQRRLQAFRNHLLNGDKENVESYGNRTRPESKTSQLESDSQFVSVEDPTQIMIEPSDSSKPSSAVRAPSARERRRWKKVEEMIKNTKFATETKPVTPSGYSMNSVTSFNVDEIALKNEERLRRLESIKQARSETKGDPNEILKQFIQRHSRPESKISESSLPADKRHIPNSQDE